MEVKLREKIMKDGSSSLYLDIYYEGKRKYDFLNIHISNKRKFSKEDQERMSKINLGPLSADLRKTTEHTLPNIVQRYLRKVAFKFWKGSSPFVPVVRV